jgi:hypothetical protein
MAVLFAPGFPRQTNSDSPQGGRGELGTITGALADSNDGRPLQYANVVVVGTTLGAMTSSDGSFRISNVPVGSFLLKIMMIGYESSESQITVRPNETTHCEFKMDKIWPYTSAADSAIVGSEVQVDPKDILCELRPGKKAFKVGDPLEFDLRLQNLSDKTFYLIGCLEESRNRTPYPYTYCIVSGPDQCADSSIVMLFSTSDDTLNPEDFRQLAPGNSFDPFLCERPVGPRRTPEFASPISLSNYSFTKPGHFTVYFKYNTFETRNGQWFASKTMRTFSRDVAALLKQVPKLDVNCWIDFEVEE